MDLQNARYTVKNVHVFVPVFLYVVTMLIFQIKRAISNENAKNLGRSDDAKRRKTRGWSKKLNRRTQIEPGNGVETIFDTRFRLSRPFFVKWR